MKIDVMAIIETTQRESGLQKATPAPKPKETETQSQLPNIDVTQPKPKRQPEAVPHKDLSREEGTIRVLHGKGDKHRVVGLDDGAWAILERWLDRRTDLKINGRKRLFCTLKGDPIQAAYVRALLPRLARKAGIEKRVHAHGLRHTHAFELANEGHPLHVIQAQLGHSSLAVTDRYIRHLAPQEVVDTMRGRKWEL